MRKKYNTWHHVSSKKGVSIEDRQLEPRGDILRGLKHFEQVLRSPKSSKEEKVFALKFLVHMMGDLHQTLHVGYPDDNGGNLKGVKWFGVQTNLHAVWDEKLIQLEAKKWMSGDYVDWAKESRAYLPKVYLGRLEGKYWEYGYSYQHREFLNKRLMMGEYVWR